VQFFNQLCHTFHHVFTTKTPQLKSTLAQNHPQKPRQNNKRVLRHHAQFFSAKSPTKTITQQDPPPKWSPSRSKIIPMSLFFAAGSATTEMSPAEVKAEIKVELKKPGQKPMRIFGSSRKW